MNLDRIRFWCDECGNPGVIRSVAVNASHLFLEGICLDCGKRVEKLHSISASVKWIAGEAAASAAAGSRMQ